MPQTDLENRFRRELPQRWQPKPRSPAPRPRRDGTYLPTDERRVAVCAVHSQGKSDHLRNRDAADAWIRDDVAVMVVADGISGTGEEGGDLARAVTKRVIAAVRYELGQGVIDQDQEHAPPFSTAWFDELFAEFPLFCREVLGLSAQAAAEEDPSKAPATTLIVALRLPDELIIAYAGDGAVKLSTGRLIVVRNLLVPHWTDVQHITRAVSALDEVRPTIMRIRPDFDEGDVVLIGTDGAFPPSHRQADPTVEIIDGMRAWCHHNHAWKRTSPYIARAMQKLLLATLTTRTWDDDATIGVMVSQRALEFWQ